MVQALQQSASMQRAIARSLGKAACIYGYPLVEVLRACRLQTTSRYDLARAGFIAMNTLNHSASPTVDRGDEDAAAGFATSALYTTAWICLTAGSLRLRLPAIPADSGHRLRFTLHDARGDSILDSGADAHAGADLLLTGPHTPAPDPSGVHTHVPSSTNLVWLIARIDVDPADLAGAGRLQAQIRLGTPGRLAPYKRPPAVDLWSGDPSDAFVDLLERGEPAGRLAPVFYANLCLALALSPPRAEDRELVANIRRIGLMPDAALEWGSLPHAVREGLAEGMEDAAEVVRGRLPAAAPWGWVETAAALSRRLPSFARCDLELAA